MENLLFMKFNNLINVHWSTAAFAMVGICAVNVQRKICINFRQKHTPAHTTWNKANWLTDAQLLLIKIYIRVAVGDEQSVEAIGRNGKQILAHSHPLARWFWMGFSCCSGPNGDRWLMSRATFLTPRIFPPVSPTGGWLCTKFFIQTHRGFTQIHWNWPPTSAWFRQLTKA